MKHERTEKEAARKAAEAEARADVRAVFGSTAGQRVLARLHAAAGTDLPRFRGHPDRPLDPLDAAFRDGKAEIVNAIQRTLDPPEDEEVHRPGASRA